MQKHIILIVLLSYGLNLLSQKNYLNTKFIQDKERIEKEAYKDIEKNFSIKGDSLRIHFIYYFNDFDSTGFKLDDNKYLDRVIPCYRYNFILPSIFKGSFPTKKRLEYIGYALNKADSIVAICGYVYPYKFYPFVYPDTDSKQYENIVEKVLSKEFDLCFQTSPNGLSFIWCIKNNKTYIYKIHSGEMKSLEESYINDLDILPLSDFFGKEVIDKSMEKYFIRFK